MFDVRQGDCVELMAAMPAGSVDAVVCDPPYGLEFMGKDWDSFRLDDPGTQRHRGEYIGSQGSLKATNDHSAAGRVAYGGGKRPSTYRCTGCGKRDQFRNDHDCDGDRASWKVEPIDPFGAPPTQLAFQNWCYQWALEARRVLKPGGHLLAFGGTRMYHRLVCAVEDAGFEIRDTISWMYGSGFPKSLDVSKAIDRAAGAEREVVGSRKQAPKFNVTQSGGENTGYNRRLEEGAEPTFDLTAPATPEAERWEGWGTALKPAHEPVVVARKPLSGTVAATVLEHGTGALNVDATRIEGDVQVSAGHRTGWDDDDYEKGTGREYTQAGRWPANVVLDEGAARLLDEQTGELTSRFFYCSKAGREERSKGLSGNRSSHPTVKPISLMRWLVRLVCPPGGTVLDPFCGSGSTGCAAVLEGFDFIGLEREAEYVTIAEARIAWWFKHRGDGEAADILAAGELRDSVEATGQLGMFD